MKMECSELGTVDILSCILRSAVDIHCEQDGHCGPYHKDEKEESETDVTSGVGDESDNKRAQERRRLQSSINRS